MHWVDLLIISVYFLAFIAVGVHFLRRQTRIDEPILLSLPISIATLVVTTLAVPERRDLTFLTEE